MNRTGIIIALSAAALLGGGGWYTRSWWWGAKKPTTTAVDSKDEKEKSESPEKRTIGASTPAAAAAQSEIGFAPTEKPAGEAVKPGRFTRTSEETPSSDEEEESGAGAKELVASRSANRFSSRAAGADEEEEEAAASDDAADDEPASEMEKPSADHEMTAEESTASTSEEDAAEEPTDEAAETARPETDRAVMGGSEDDAEESKPASKPEAAPKIEEPAENETSEENSGEEAPAASPPAANRFAQRDTSKAPPLRSEEEEETEESSDSAASKVPENEVMRIQEPPRAARLASAPKPSAAASEEESPTTKRSLKVAKPLENPPSLEEAPRFGGGPSPLVSQAAGELTNVLTRSLSKPEEAPGDRRLEGEQSAPLTLTKTAPSEVSVGRPAIFETRVRNNGSSVANQVIVMDRVPRGARLIEASPQYTETPDGLLIWEIGALDPGQETLIKMQLMPEEEGEIGSVASASYQVKASARTVSTRPQLEVEHTGPAKVLVGEDVTFNISIHNPGTGVARGVRIEEDVPKGLQHDEGRRLEHEIGEIPPGKTRLIELTLTAVEAGKVTNQIRVRGDGDLQAEHTTELEVLAPQLATEISGPKRRYLDRQATYSLRIANPGTSAAKMVEFSAQLPTGLKFMSADNSGRYDARKHAVFWKIENLPAGQEGVVQLVVLSTSSGQQALRAAAKAEGGLEANYELPILVEAAPETTFTVRDSSDPIEVGAESTYEIVVSNQGTRADSRVEISATLPSELEILGAEGPTSHRIEGQRVTFDPIGRLDPKSEATFRIKVKALSAAADPKVVKVQATSAALTTPVSREESTLIYEDR